MQIGIFTKTGSGLIGSIGTMWGSVELVLAPVGASDGRTQRSHVIWASGLEVGSAWELHRGESGEAFTAKIDDPILGGSLHCLILQGAAKDDFIVEWRRPGAAVMAA